MKKITLLPIVLLVAFLPALSLSAQSILEQAADSAISDAGNDESAMELNLSTLYNPGTMDCDEILDVHRTILAVAQQFDSDTLRIATRISAKLAIITLSDSCYSDVVASNLVGRIAGEIEGTNGSIIINATIIGAGDSADVTGGSSDANSNAATDGTTAGPGDTGAGDGPGDVPTAVTPGTVEVIFDSERTVSPSEQGP